VTDEREETDVAGRNTARWNGRDVIAPQEDVRNRSTDRRERAIELFRLAV
jgi:hypothetical protein